MGALAYKFDEDFVAVEFAANDNRVVQRRYIPGAAIDERVAQVDANGGVKYIHADRQNSVIAISDSSGNAISRRAYGTYGETDSSQISNSIAHPFGYTGRRWEADLGLYYYRARWYDPETATILETDPIGQLDYINLYAYVGLNPTNATDPSGMQTVNDTRPPPGLPENYKSNEYRAGENVAGKKVSTTAGGVGAAATGAEKASGKTTVRVVGGAVKVSTKGFQGNQHVNVVKASEVAKVVGNASLIVGVGADTKQLTNGTMTSQKYMENRIFDILGLTGPVGAAASVTYYGFETLYPGGANQAHKDGALVTDPDMSGTGPFLFPPNH